MNAQSQRMPLEIAFAGNPLDRASTTRDKPEKLVALLKDGEILPVWKTQPVAMAAPRKGLCWVTLDAVQHVVAKGATLVFLGTARGVGHFALDISGEPNPANDGPLAGLVEAVDMRALVPRLTPDEVAIAGQAKAMVDWHARHQFCAVCGTRTELRQGGYMRHCPQCQAAHFPRTDPVVIMLATRGDKCLLGRQKPWPAGMFSALAGFMEPGESIEEAVRREVKEEAGIEVGAVRYIATQPWPFPSSLMIGCLAEATSEAIERDDQELEEARWFDRDTVVRALAGDRNAGLGVPPAMAIAHQLLRAWIEGH
ncbi:NAD(+) diphosphatase [Zavarzinia sp. CC-PAN008]|uniref:NAD(+) diphosphatase n=1 Tax=Zavarzinia sp. CC-PAN008 TaxID=3243332 RepID=UPI003F74ACA8